MARNVEIKARLADPGALCHAIARSMGVRATVQKRRSVYLLGQTRIHLDAVDDLGSFVELEVVLRDGQSASDGEQIAASLMDTLSISPAALIPLAYVDLLEQSSAAL